MILPESVQQFMSGTRKNASSKPPALLKWRSSTFLIVMTVCMALFTDIFYYALIIPVIPFSLTVQVGLPEDQVQHWTSILLACYSVALFVASPIVGLYADHTSSRRWPLLIGLLCLAASTLLLCFGKSIGLLVLGRLLQGFSAAVVWSVGCALLVDTMESSVGVAMGYVNIAMSVGLLVAPVIGGSVYTAAGYYAVYYIAFGVVLVDVLLRLAMIEKKVARQWLPEETSPEQQTGEQDIEKRATLPSTAGGPHQAVSTLGVETADIDDSSRFPEAPQTALDTASEPQASDPSPEQGAYGSSKTRPILVLLKSPRLLAALYAIVAQAGLMMGFDAVLALFVESTFGWNSTAAGLMFLAIFLPGFASPLAGMLADRYGAKWPSFAGFALTVPSIICLRFVTENTIGQKVLLGVILAVTGTALTFSNTPLMAEISYVISEEARRNPGIFGEKGVYGIGYGLFTMAFALGGVLGPLWAGYVYASAGWGTMTWSLALWGVSGAIVVLIWLGGKPQKPEPGQEALPEQRGSVHPAGK